MGKGGLDVNLVTLFHEVWRLKASGAIVVHYIFVKIRSLFNVF